MAETYTVDVDTLFDSDYEEFLYMQEQERKKTVGESDALPKDPPTRWVNTGWWDKRGCYILDYYEGGVHRCTMLAYPDHRQNCFKVYPYRLAPYGLEFPKVKTVDFRYVSEERTS